MTECEWAGCAKSKVGRSKYCHLHKYVAANIAYANRNQNECAGPDCHGKRQEGSNYCAHCSLMYGGA